MAYLGFLAICTVLVATTVCGDVALETVESSPVNKAPYTIWFPVASITSRFFVNSSTLLTRQRRAISIRGNHGSIKQLSYFIQNNIKSYSKIKLRGAKKICIDVNKVKVNDLYSMVNVGWRRKDNILFHKGKFNVENHYHSVAESLSQSHTFTRTDSVSITVSNTIGLSGNIVIPLRLISLSPTVTFSNEHSSTKTETIEQSVTIPPQRVMLNPMSKRQLTYNLCREELVTEYNATFLVDQKSTFKVSYTSFIFRKSRDLNLMDFLREMHEKNRTIKIPNIEYGYVRRKLTMGNYPVTRSVINDAVNMVFGAEEPIVILK